MKKILTVLATATVISVVLVTSLGVTAFAEEGPCDYIGPAPNSGDGIPDGSGFDGEVGSEESPGPAPNSGDCEPNDIGF